MATSVAAPPVAEALSALVSGDALGLLGSSTAAEPVRRSRASVGAAGASSTTAGTFVRPGCALADAAAIADTGSVEGTTDSAAQGFLLSERELTVGVIMGSFPMEAPEHFQDNLKILDTKLFPDVSEPIPDILVHDRACQVHRAFKFKNSLYEYSFHWALLLWLVDRFHYHSHSTKDEHCKY
eukprot:jgi/Ulvmu1/970/UM102_0054.1